MASVVDMPDVDHAGSGVVRRRREWRLRAYLRCAWMSVAMALAEATHHSAPRRLKTAKVVEEVEAHEQYNAPQGQEQPPPEDAGPQAAVTVGYVAAEAPSLVAAPVAEDDGLDDATVQYLLQQSLLARAEEEKVAKEQAALDQLVGDLAVKEGQLLAELQSDRGDAVRITGET